MSSLRPALASVSPLAMMVALLSPALPASAQTVPTVQPPSPEQQAPPATPEPEAASEDVTVVVTGSRIARPALTSPNPVTTVDSNSILLSGETNLTDYLQTVPALVGSLDSGQTSGSAGFIGSTGINLLNLRNLGTQRTLVLVDGRRHVAQLPETAAVDIGTIPQDLIDRIDVATGGVSAVYGADAVSGVVNFVMKKDFEGIVARGQIGVAEQGEPMNWTASLTAGKNFSDDRGNISAAFQYTHEGRLQARDRSFLRGTNYRTMQENPDDPDDDPNLPDQVPLRNIRFFDSARGGAIDYGSFDEGGVFIPGEFDGVPDLRPDGSLFDGGLFIPPFYQQGGDGTLRSDYIGDVLARNDRYVASLFVNYEFADWAKFFAEGKFAHGKAFSESQPSFDFYTFYAPDNALLPAALVPFAEEAGGILLSRDNFDLGIRAEDNKRDTWRGVAGFNGDITKDIKYEISYTYGQSKVKNISTNNRFNDRFFAAQDAVIDPATGQLACRINVDPTALPSGFEDRVAPDGDGIFEPGELSFTPGPGSGCLPLNLFGEGVASPAAIDFVMTDSKASSKLTQQVLNGFVSGKVPGFELPGGPISFVVGAEYRKETSRSTPPLEDTAGLTFGNVILPVKGDFDVKEAFGELRLPILRDRPFFHELEASGALRFSDYSTVGSTTTWNLGGRWSPVRDISFRGTYARTVRAPNIGELFSPQSQDFQFITDPCDVENINNGSSTRAANCAAILSAFGIDPTTFTDPNSASIPGLQRGNVDLIQETAKSWTVGAVITPDFVRGLTVTVDWYNINIRDAINTATPEEVAENCVDQPTIDNIFCAAIERDPADGGISSFLVQPENVANFRTAGLDFDVNYRLDPANLGLRSDIGIFNLRLLGNYLKKLTFIPSPGAELDDDRTEQFAPKWQATFDLTWMKDPFTVNYGFNYFSKTKRFSLEDIAGDPDIASKENISYDARHTHDVQVALDVLPTFRLYAGVNNLTDQKPDISTNYPVNPIGRLFYVGARATLPKF